MHFLSSKESMGETFGLSLKVIGVILVVMILFGVYLINVLFGENSLTVLNALQEDKESLSKEAFDLKSENQRLQKEFFELKQLQPGEVITDDFKE